MKLQDFTTTFPILNRRLLTTLPFSALFLFDHGKQLIKKVIFRTSKKRCCPKVHRLQKIKRILLRILLSMLGLAFLFAFYSNSLIGVNDKSINYYKSLKETVKKRGLKDRMYVISGKRFKFLNSMLVKYGNAVSTSRHLKGEAIDILVFDVNDDGLSDSKDVDIVYHLLDGEIVKNKGGIGTYKNQSGLFTRQMVHFDCRGYRARWKR